MNANTPVQPNDHEVRTFRIGPITEEDFALQPPLLHHSMQKVGAGEAHENDDGIDVVAPRVQALIDAVKSEILLYAERYMMNEGVTEAEVHRAIDELHAADKLVATPEHLRVPRRFMRIYRDVIQDILTKPLTGVSETLINHAKHGNKDPRKMIGGRYWVDENGKFTVVSWDEGEGFEPDTIADPTDPERITIPNGRGRLMSELYADAFSEGTEGTTGRQGTSTQLEYQLRNLSAVPHRHSDFSQLTASTMYAVERILREDEQKRSEDDAREKERAAEQKRRASYWFRIQSFIRSIRGS